MNDNHITKKHLTPREWVSLFIRDHIYIERFDGQNLTPNEQRILYNGWKPENEKEGKEFKRLINEWQKIQFAQMDAKLAYYGAMEQCDKAEESLVFFILNDKRFSFIENFLDSNGPILIKEDPLHILLKNSWIELDHLIYLFAFELMDLGLKKDLWIAYKNVMLDENYLKDQETIANILSEDKSLNEESKGKLVEAILDKIFYKNTNLIWLKFASFPTIEVGKKWAEFNTIYCVPTEQEKNDFKFYSEKMREERILENRLSDFAIKYNSSAKKQLSQTIKKLLDEGLLDIYPPFFGNNRQIKGDSGEHTNYSGQKIYDEWMRYIEMARETVQQHIDKEELILNTVTSGIDKKPTQAILAHSLYDLAENYGLVDDFKKQMASFETLGTLVGLWDCDSFDGYRSVLSQSIKIIKESSKVLGFDLNYKIDDIRDYIGDLNKSIEHINSYIDQLITSYVSRDWDNKTRSKLSVQISISQINPITE